MKILFWGNGDFGVPIFQKLLTLEHETALITMPARQKGRGRKLIPNNLRKTAEEYGVVYTEQDDLSELPFVQYLTEVDADINIVVDYGKIIPASLLSLFPDKFVNIHPSLLPVYRGASPIQTALLNGDSVTGVTIQKMVRELDAGDILLQKSLAIADEDNYGTLSEKLTALSSDMVCDLLDNWGNLTSVKQEREKVSFCHKFSKDDFTTDWHESAEKIHNRVRAFSPNYGIKNIFRDKILKIFKTEPVSDCQEELADGVIADVTKKYFIVKCQEGCLKILSLQPQNKKVMPAGDFINGYKPQAGEKLRSVLC